MIAKARFILRFRGQGSRPAADVAAIRDVPDTTIVDDSGARMLLVDGPEPELRAAVARLHDWELSPERTFERPDPRKKIAGG